MVDRWHKNKYLKILLWVSLLAGKTTGKGADWWRLVRCEVTNLGQVMSVGIAVSARGAEIDYSLSAI